MYCNLVIILSTNLSKRKNRIGCLSESSFIAMEIEHKMSLAYHTRFALLSSSVFNARKRSSRERRSRLCCFLIELLKDNLVTPLHVAFLWINYISLLIIIITMTYLSSWEEFEKGAERLYLQDPINVCFKLWYKECYIYIILF